DAQFEFTGEFRRKCEIVSVIELLSSAPLEHVASLLTAIDAVYPLEKNDNDTIIVSGEQGPKYEIKHSPSDRFVLDLFLTTASPAHLEKLHQLNKEILPLTTEQEIYNSLGLQFIPPELREGLQEIDWS